jgi:hypothetical protein
MFSIGWEVGAKTAKRKVSKKLKQKAWTRFVTGGHEPRSAGGPVGNDAS